MFYNLLASNVVSYVFIGVIVVLLVAFFVWSYISNKKKPRRIKFCGAFVVYTTWNR